MMISMAATLWVAALLLTPITLQAQGLHFSQYYNTPLLLNPANTGVSTCADYRAGAIYRRQWASVPVPFQTISAFADVKLFKSKEEHNWLALGLSVYNDKAGNGELSLTNIQGSIAYHVQLGDNSMVSVGGSAGSVQRTVNYNKLTYDSQWDGFTFNRSMANFEDANVGRSSYTDVGAGVNYSYFSSENLMITVGAGVTHLNRPQESFYGQTNQISIRPTISGEMVMRLNPAVIISPSIYYTQQRGASELIYGTLLDFDLSTNYEDLGTSLILGGFHRWNESIVIAAGIRFSDVRIIASYDYTLSTLSPVNKGRGALEFGLMYQGVYNREDKGRSVRCPRF
jgi:type IX secretion system PorP/SprF family membrane protein